MAGVDPATYATVVEFNGPIVGSVLVYSMLYGVALVMGYDYYRWCADDPWILKALVSWEMVMGTFHFIFMSQQMWYKSITGWGNIATVFHTEPGGNILNVTTLFMLIPSQLFYLGLAFRALNRNYYFLGLMGAAITMVAASGAAVTIELLFMNQTFATLTLLPNLYLWGALCVDIVIAAVLCARFRVLQQGTGDQARSVLWSFMALSVRTSAATTGMALFERLSHVTGHGLLAQAPGLILAGVILLSLLHTLNSRKQLSARLAGDATSIHAPPTRFGRNKNTAGGDVNPRSEIRVDTIVLQAIETEKPDGNQIAKKAGYNRDNPFRVNKPTVQFDDGM